MAPSLSYAQCSASELRKILPDDGDPGDHFGEAISFCPDSCGTLIIGAHVDDDAGGNAGSAYIFRVDENGNWMQEQKLLASDADAFDRFGTSVAIHGNYAIISATNDDDACKNNQLCESGAAYIFRYDPISSMWIEEQKLLASDATQGFLFGISVSIYGDVAIVGAIFHSDVFQSSGAAYVFRRNTKTGIWSEEQILFASDPAAHDWFGFSISLIGETALIGAHRHDDGGGDSGAVFVFRYDAKSKTWIEEQKLLASDGDILDKFGSTLSLATGGELAIIGAIGNDDAGDQSGSAYIFRYDSSKSLWIQEQKLTASDAAAGDLFGNQVSIIQDTAIIGAIGDDDNGNLSGSAYVFHYDPKTSQWIEQAKLTASDGNISDKFGFAVSSSSDGTAIISAIDDDDSGENSGTVFLFAGLNDCNNNGIIDICDIADGTAQDKNHNGTPDSCEPAPCPWDLDLSGNVSVADLLVLFAQWGTGGSADFDGSGAVDTKDLLILFANWGPCG
ncbi:MAG: FG-GAP repeat protein [Planctomycetes bacterium]|nr:FG-GAP repeat protein [Planctomycetota bacterium]